MSPRQQVHLDYRPLECAEVDSVGTPVFTYFCTFLTDIRISAMESELRSRKAENNCYLIPFTCFPAQQQFQCFSINHSCKHWKMMTIPWRVRFCQFLSSKGQNFIGRDDLVFAGKQVSRKHVTLSASPNGGFEISTRQLKLRRNESGKSFLSMMTRMNKRRRSKNKQLLDDEATARALQVKGLPRWANIGCVNIGGVIQVRNLFILGFCSTIIILHVINLSCAYFISSLHP